MKKYLCAILLTAAAGVPSFSSTPTATAQPAAPKTHVLYMGVDLDWQQGTEFRRVSAIKGRTAVVRVDGRERAVRMGKDNNNFKVVNSLKLGKPAVQLDNVKLDRFYTPGNDPQRRFMESFALSTAAMDETMVARQLSMRDQYFVPFLTEEAAVKFFDENPDYWAMLLAEREAELTIAMSSIDALADFTRMMAIPQINPRPSQPPGPKMGSVTLGPLEIEETDVAVPEKKAGSGAPKAQPSVASAAPAVPTEGTPVTTTPGDAAEPPASAAPRPAPAAIEAKPFVVASAQPVVVPGGEWYDAFELKFEVSSEKPIAEPYVVIVINYIDPQNPQKPRQWVHAQQIDPIGPKPSVVRLKYAGLPPGFLPKSPKIHIFDGGQELATVAPGSMLLTREEASEYALLEYLSKNKKATLPPTPLMADLPEDLRQQLSASTFPKVVFVQVDAKGRTVAAFADEGRRQRIEDASVVSVLREIRFGPALDKGKAVPGIARVAVADIPL